jgi:large repetitive protein
VGSCGGTTTPGSTPVTCNFGSLASGASASVAITAKVNSDVPQGFVLVNNATVSSAATDSDNANNKATATSSVNAVADLVTLKTSDKAAYKPSSLVTYTIKVTNNGPSKALAVQVVDNLPIERQAIYQSNTGGCTKSGLTLTCVLGDMDVGTSRSFNINMVIKGSRGDVSNTATAVSSTTDPDTNNNLSTRTVRIGN